MTALVQCLVDACSDRLDRGEALPTMQPWFVRENKWRAARYGMEAGSSRTPPATSAS